MELPILDYNVLSIVADKDSYRIRYIDTEDYHQAVARFKALRIKVDPDDKSVNPYELRDLFKRKKLVEVRFKQEGDHYLIMLDYRDGKEDIEKSSTPLKLYAENITFEGVWS